MSATETLLRRAAADGVTISVTPDRAVKVRGTRHAVDRWLPAIREHKPEIIAALVADAGRRWLVRFAGGEPFELVCSDPVAVDIVRRLYPTAASVEPAPIVYTRAATDVETAELETLIASVLASDGPEERAEALAIAVADPAAALVCYRLLASCATSAAGRSPTNPKPIKKESR